MRYAIATGRRRDDPAAALKGAFRTRAATHLPALSRTELGPFLRALVEYPGRTVRVVKTISKDLGSSHYEPYWPLTRSFDAWIRGRTPESMALEVRSKRGAQGPPHHLGRQRFAEQIALCYIAVVGTQEIALQFVFDAFGHHLQS